MRRRFALALCATIYQNIGVSPGRIGKVEMWSGSSLRTAALVLVAALLTCSGAQAQSTPSPKPIEPIVNVRLRGEYWNWFDAPNTRDEYAYLGGFVRLGVRQNRGNWSWLVEGATPVLIGLPGSAAGFGANYRNASGEQNLSLFLKQGFLTLQPERTPGLTMRAGRFEFSDGNEGPPTDGTLATLRRERIAERLVGPFGFSHIGRSFDGLDLRRATKTSGLTLMAARATQGVFNLHGMNHLDVGIAYASASRLLTTDNIKADGRLFALAYRDGRPLPKVDNRPASARLRDSSAVKLLTVGGHLAAVRDFAGGQADVLLWGAWQTGEWGALDHNASAFGLEAGAQWKVPHLDPWLRAGYWRSSGDEDAEDAEHGTFFQVLPTPRVYARFPFYNLMNSEDIFAELVLRPSADWTIRSDAHVLKLTSAGDSWYAGGGAFEDGTFGYSARTAGARVLARVIDTSIEYRATPQLGFTVYIAHANPDRVLESNYPGTAAGLFGFLEVRWRR